jgi:prevent-host-death family protein
MKKVNVHEAKTHLSRYLEEVERGEIVLICRRNVPVAELRRLAEVGSGRRRPVGRGKTVFRVPDSFFEPLPENLVRSFEGSD